MDHVHSAHARQAQVDQRDIGLVLAKLRDRLHAIGGFAHHFKAFDHIQQGHQSLAHDVVVFDHQTRESRLLHVRPVVLNGFLPPVSRRRRRADRTVVPSPGCAAHFKRAADGRRALSHSRQSKAPRHGFRLLVRGASPSIVAHFQRNRLGPYSSCTESWVAPACFLTL